MENFIVTACYLLIGIALRISGRMPEGFSNSLNQFVIYVSLPALVLLKIPQMPLGAELFFTAALPWVMLAVSAAAVLAASRLLGWPRHITGCLLLMVPLGNTSFLGIPMVRAFFGDGAVAYAMLYDQLGSFLALSTYGAVILATYAGNRDVVPSAREVLVRILTFPPLIALVLAFGLRPFTMPEVALNILSTLGATLVPVVMISVGFQLSLRLEPGALGPMGFGLAFKLLVAPLLALALVAVLGLSGEPVQVAVFESGMPPMVSAGALAIMSGLAPRLTAAMVGGGIVLCFLTLPLLFRLILAVT